MPLDHNTQARLVSNSILNNWRLGRWQNRHISKKVFLTRIPSGFPNPDGCFFEPQAHTRIALEFKPEESESQRGLLTGVGQCIAYLNKFGAAYLVAPNAVSDNAGIGNYLEQTFRNSIYGKLPIGLITYNSPNLINLRLRCDISDRVRLASGSERGLDVNYWAAWRDTPPHAIYLLLKTANEITDQSNRSEKIWKTYYFGKYITPGSIKTIQDVPSNIKMWDGTTAQVPLRGIKETLRKKVSGGTMTVAQALLEIKKKIDPNGIDNNYRDIKKNHYNFVNHLVLWDSDFRLTEYGKKLLEIGDKFGGASQELKNYLGYLLLTVGRHIELIGDVRNAINNSQNAPNNINDVRAIAYDYLESKGYIKTNPNRTTSGVRKFLQSEFGVWGHFGILNERFGSYFTANTGLAFNDNRIKELLALGQK